MFYAVRLQKCSSDTISTKSICLTKVWQLNSLDQYVWVDLLHVQRMKWVCCVQAFCNILALFKINSRRKDPFLFEEQNTKQRSNFYCFTCNSSTDVPIWVQFSQARYKTTHIQSIYSHKLHNTLRMDHLCNFSIKIMRSK